MLNINPDSDYYKQLNIRYYAALNLQYTGYKNMLLGLVQDYMPVAVVEKNQGMIPYKVTFSNLIPGNSSEAYLFYPEGYLKLQTGIDNYPDDYPTDIMNTISHDSNDYFISNNYLKDGEFLIVYKIENDWYKFTFETNDNKLIKVNNEDVDLENNESIWFDKIDKNIKSKIKILNYNSINSNIDIRRQFEELRSKINVLYNNSIDSSINISDVSSSSLKSRVNIKLYNELNAKINLTKSNNIDSHIIITRFDSLNSKVRIFEQSTIKSNIVICNKENIDSNIKVTSFNDLKSNVKLMNTKDLFGNIYVHYSDETEIPANVFIKKFAEIYSMISSDRTAHTVQSNIIIRRSNITELKSDIFIIGQGHEDILSNVQVRKHHDLQCTAFIVKYVGIPSNIIIGPHGNSDVESNVNIYQNENLHCNVVVSPNSLLFGKYNVANSNNIKSTISIRQNVSDGITGNINVIEKIRLIGKANIEVDYHKDLKCSILIPTQESINSNIYVKGFETLIAKTNIYIDNISDIKSHISIPEYNAIKSTLFIPYKDMTYGEIEIKNAQNDDINSNIFVKYSGINDVYSTLNVIPHNFVSGKIDLFSGYVKGLESHIDVFNTSSIKSNIFIQPFDVSYGGYVSYKVTSDSLNSNIVVTHHNDLISNMIIIPSNELYGKANVHSNLIKDLHSNIFIRRTDSSDIYCKLNILFTKTNKMESGIKFVNFDKSASIVSKLTITNVNDIPSTIKITTPILNVFKITSNMIPTTLNDLDSNVLINHYDQIKSNIVVSLLNKTKAVIDTMLTMEDNLNSNIIVTKTNNLPSNIKILNSNKAMAMAEVFKTIDAYEFVPTKDSYVMENIPTENYGGATNLFVGNAYNGQTKSILGFNLSSIKSEVGHAYLKFRAVNMAELNNLEVYPEDYDWQEYGITWKNYPETNEKPIAKISNTGSKTNIVFDVTNYVKQMLNEGNSKLAFGLYQASDSMGSAKRFYSRHTAFSPTLTVEYERDLKEKYSDNEIQSNIIIRHNDISDLDSCIDIRRYDDISSLKSKLMVRDPHTIIGNINIVRGQIRSNIIIRKGASNDLQSNIFINYRTNEDINSFIVINGFTLPGNLTVRLNDKADIDSNVQIYNNKDLAMTVYVNNPQINSNIIVKTSGHSDINSNIIISKKVINSNIIVCYNTNLKSRIAIIHREQNTLPSNIVVNKIVLTSNIIVSRSESRKSNIIIRQHTENDLPLSLNIRPCGHSDLAMNLMIRQQVDLDSTLRISRPKMESNIIIRQFGESDLPSTLKVYVFDGYITII